MHRNSISHITTGAALDFLDARADTDPIAAAAARIIRSQQVEISMLENEIVEAEWKAMAHAVEIERVKAFRTDRSARLEVRGRRHAA